MLRSIAILQTVLLVAFSTLSAWHYHVPSHAEEHVDEAHHLAAVSANSCENLHRALAETSLLQAGFIALSIAALSESQHFSFYNTLFSRTHSTNSARAPPQTIQNKNS